MANRIAITDSVKLRAPRITFQVVKAESREDRVQRADKVANEKARRQERRNVRAQLWA